MLTVKSPLGRVLSLRRRRSKRVVSVSLPDIREDSVVEGSSSLATVKSAFVESVSTPPSAKSLTPPQSIPSRQSLTTYGAIVSTYGPLSW